MSNLPHITQVLKVQASIGTEVARIPKPMTELKLWGYYSLSLLSTTHLALVFIL